jgi:membrane protein DedA with SNARE-associated domain
LLYVNGLQAFVDALLSFYATNELLGLFLFLVIEEAGVPLWFLPGDVLVILAGSRPGRTPGSVAMIVLAATAGTFIGSSLLYLVVRRGGPPLLDRYGHFLHLDKKRIATVEAWFRRYGPLAIVVGRLVPGLRTPTTLMAATFQVPYSVFAPATALAAVLWTLLYFFAGAFLAQQWQTLVASVAANLDDIAQLIVFLLLVAIAVGVVIRHRDAARQRGAVRSDDTHPV